MSFPLFCGLKEANIGLQWPQLFNDHGCDWVGVFVVLIYSVCTVDECWCCAEAEVVLLKLCAPYGWDNYLAFCCAVSG